MWSQEKDGCYQGSTTVQEDQDRKRSEERERQEAEQKREEERRARDERKREEERIKELKLAEERKQHEKEVKESRQRWLREQQTIAEEEIKRDEERKRLRQKEAQESEEKRQEEDRQEQLRKQRQEKEEEEREKKKREEQEMTMRKDARNETVTVTRGQSNPRISAQNTQSKRSTLSIAKGGQSQRISLYFPNSLQQKRTLTARTLIEAIAEDREDVEETLKKNSMMEALPSNAPQLEEIDLANLEAIISSGQDYPLIISKHVRKEVLLHALKSFKFDITTLSNKGYERTKGKVLALLQERHPIHSFVKEMSPEDVKLIVKKINGFPLYKHNQRNKSALTRYVTSAHPSGPLFYLKKLIKECKPVQNIPRGAEFRMDMTAFSKTFEDLILDELRVSKDFIDESSDPESSDCIDEGERDVNINESSMPECLTHLTSYELKNLRNLISSKKDFSLIISKHVTVEEIDECLKMLGEPSKAKRKHLSNLKKNLDKALRKKHPINDFIMQLTKAETWEISFQLGLEVGEEAKKKDIRTPLLNKVCDLAPMTPIDFLKNLKELCCKPEVTFPNFCKDILQKIQDKEDFSILLNENIPRSEYIKLIENFDMSCAPNTSEENLEKKVTNVLKAAHPVRELLNTLNIKMTEEIGHLIGVNVKGKKEETAKNLIAEKIFSLHSEQPLRAYENYLSKAKYNPVDSILKEVKNNSDYSLLVVDSLSRPAIKELLTRLNIQINERLSTKTHRDKLKIVLKEEHTVSKQLNKCEYSYVYGICRGLGDVISKEKFVLASTLRKALCDYIFQNQPDSPLAYFKVLFKQFLAREMPTSKVLPYFRGYPLLNQANHCYVNASINGLMSVDYVRKKIHSRTNKNPLENYLSNLSYYTSEDVRSIINRNGPKFPYGQQCDAHEFLMDFLGNLQDTFISTIVSETLECQDCKHVTVRETPETCPQFPVSYSTEIMIQDLTVLDKNCTACGDDLMHPHLVVSTVESAGKLLCLSAGRTAPDSKNKVMETSEFITVGHVKYVIRGVICHQGESVDSGHYYTLIRQKDGSWSKVNDSLITSGLAPEKNSYVFFYEQLESDELDNVVNLPEPMEFGDSSSPVKSLKDSLGKYGKQRKIAHEKHLHAKRNLHEEQKLNIEKVKAIRKIGMEAVNTGKSNIGNISLANPIIFEGLKAFEEMKQEFVLPETSCKICHNSFHGMQLFKGTEFCARCFKEKDQPFPTFGIENDMIPVDIPEVLKVLNFVEVSSISLAAALLHVYARPGGKTGLKGNTITFEQDLKRIITVLPLLPKDLPFIILESANENNTLEFTVRPQLLLDALVWLKANNHLYKNVTISEENLDHYQRSNGKVIGIRKFNYAYQPDQKKREAEEKRDQEPPMADKDQVNEKDLDGDFPSPDSLVPCVTESDDLETLLRKAVQENTDGEKTEDRKESQENVTENSSAQEQNPPHLGEVRLPWPERARDPLSEFSDYYYAKCLPNLFPDGVGGEFNRQRKGKQPPFKGWVNHLLNYKDGRFSNHAFFPMLVANQLQRRTALTLGNVIGKQSAKDMTMRQFKEELEKENSDILNKVQYYSQRVPGSNSYFYTKTSQAKAMAEHLRHRSEDTEMFNVFLTLSMADMHLKDLHELFPESSEYLNKTVVEPLEMPLDDTEAEPFITKSKDFLLRRQNVNNRALLVVNYFCTKVERLVTEVLPKTIGVKEFIIRYEFQSRGAIHAHVLLSCLNGPSAPELELALNTTLRKDPKADLEMAKEDNVDSSRLEYLETKVSDLENAQKAMEKLVYFSAHQIGISCLHPNSNPSEWKQPYGQNVAEPVTHPCREDIVDTLATESSVRNTYENLVNICQSHKCMMKYCLKEVKTGKKKDEKKDEKIDIKDSAKDEALERTSNAKQQTLGHECRFKFPKDPVGFKYETELMNDKEVITKVERIPRNLPLGCGVVEEPSPVGSNVRGSREFKTIRNHPVVNSHVPEISFLWQGNTDCQIIESNDNALRYLLKYMMKEEVSSTEHQKAMKAAVATINDNLPGRKGFQKILLKSTRRDISRQESMLLLNSDRDYVKMSLIIIPCSLIGNKRLEIKNCGLDEKMARDDGWQDKYFSRETDPNFKKACQDFEKDPEAWRALFPLNYKNPKSPQETSLHNFISFFTKNWYPKKQEAVPYCTPYFQYIPKCSKKEKHEAYCRTRLLQFKPGANPDNLLTGFENNKDCLQDFVKNDKHCPAFLKDDFETSLESEDSDKESENDKETPEEEDADFDGLDLSSDDLSDYGITDEMKLLRQLLETNHVGDLHADADYDDACDAASDYDAADIVEQISHHDWSKSYKDLNLDKQAVKNYTSWINEKKQVSALDGQEVMDLSDVNPESLNEKQTYAYKLFTNWIDKVLDPETESQQLLLQIQGIY